MPTIPSTVDHSVSTGEDRPARGRSRIAALDSLRGIAALVVVVHHVIGIFPPLWRANEVVTDGKPLTAVDAWVKLLAFSPLRIFWFGGGAVIIFFALSGFVLMLPFLERPPSYKEFLIKRFFRIYPACWAALILSWIGVTLIGYHLPAGSAPQAMTIWYSGPPNLLVAFMHFFILGGPTLLDPVIWSLFHEVRISILFPLIAGFVARRNSDLVLYLWAGIYLGTEFIKSQAHGLLDGQVSSAAETTGYVFVFVCGALLAKHRWELRRWFGSLFRSQKLFLAVACIALYLAPWEIALISPPLAGSSPSYAMMRFGAVLALALVVMSAGLDQFMRHPVLVWLGKISYSLYLIHFVVLGSLVYGVEERAPLWLAAVLTIPVSIMAAGLLQKFIEEPFIRFAKGLLRRPERESQIMQAHTWGCTTTAPEPIESAMIVAPPATTLKLGAAVLPEEVPSSISMKASVLRPE
jgi:peptidoglycan/LPS O-acetylase OafA/YrhL